jgi:hypothetical protein
VPPSPAPPEDSLKPSARALRYALAIAVVVAGILCGAIIPGTLGGTICTAVVGVGLVAVVSLVFYDVGLTEDRDRARREKRLERLGPADPQQRHGQPSHPGDGRSGDRPLRRPRQTRIRDEHGRLG